jgi:predicted Fe-Mo cluster-binding NifX family protein
MIYAIAITDNKLSHKFSQSEFFHFYNEQQELVGVYKNPVIGSKGCSTKNLIIDLFLKMQCDIVVVRKVGEKTLAKLLAAGFKVEQGNTRHTLEQLLTEAALQKNLLTSPDQGVKKMKSSDHKH